MRISSVSSLTLHFLLISTLAISAAGLNQVAAEGPALDIQSTTGGQDLNNGSFSLGWTFTVTSTVSVSALGFYDADKDGLTTSHDVGIYDAGCNLVANTTVLPTDTLVSYFRYHQLTSAATLSPGQTYIIAAVTGGEPYLYNPTTVVLDPSVVFGKFNAWQGAFQQTTTLKCPNFPATTQFYGDFGPTFYVGTLSDNPGDSGKRETAISIFCNRTGSDLLTARCTATIADQGEPPRSLPTGTIDWTSSDGLVPVSAQCISSQVASSPGIGACDVTFSLPEGFPIGVRFPIDASYSGDANFKGSSTSHRLIVAECAGDDCPNAVGLTFDEYPQILKDRLQAFISCGFASSASSAQVLGHRETKKTPAAGTCTTTTSGQLDIPAFFVNLPYDEAVKIGQQITESDAQKDTLLYYLKNAEQVERKERWDTLMKTQEAIMKLTEDVIKNRVEVRKSNNPYDKFKDFIMSVFIRKSKSKPFDKSLATDKVVKVIEPNKIGGITLKLPTRVKTLVKYLKKAGYTQLPVTLTLSVKQKKRKGTAKVTSSVNLIVK